jgi:hypothetical protein
MFAMPLTRLQARDQYIFDSVGLFLDRNLKTAYDIEAAATSGASDPAQCFPTPLTIRAGKPDDITIVRAAPSIAIDMVGSGEADRAYEVGSANIWRHRAFLLSCWPSLDSTGSPCDAAHRLLRTYLQDTFEGECIRIVDYSNSLCSSGNILFTSDVMYVCKVSDPIDRGQTTALAEEKHRFDFHFAVKYCTLASLAS